MMSKFVCNEVRNNFKRNFNDILKKNNMSTKTVSQKLDLPVTIVKDIKNNASDEPSPEVFVKIKNALNVSAADLLGNPPNSENNIYSERLRYYIYRTGGINSFSKITNISEKAIKEMISSNNIDRKYKNKLLNVLSEDEFYSLQAYSQLKLYENSDNVSHKLNNFNAASLTNIFMKKAGLNEECMSIKLNISKERFSNIIHGLNTYNYASDIEKILNLPEGTISNNKFNAFSENNIIGRTLQVYANNNKMNAVDLAKYIGISYEEIKKILKGYIVPSSNEIKALANALKINIDELEEAYTAQNITEFKDDIIIKAFKIYCKTHNIKQQDLIKEYNNMHFNTMLNANKFDPVDKDKQIQTMCFICNKSLDNLYAYATTYDPSRYDNLYSIILEAALRNNISLNNVIECYHTDKKNMLMSGNVNKDDTWLTNALSLLDIPIEDVEKYFKKPISKKATKPVSKSRKETKEEEIKEDNNMEHLHSIEEYANSVEHLHSIKEYETTIAKLEDTIENYKEKIISLENQITELSSNNSGNNDSIININDLDVVDKFVELIPKSQIAVLKLAAKLLSDDYLQKLVFKESNNIRNTLIRSIYLMNCLSRLDDKSVIIDLINNLS